MKLALAALLLATVATPALAAARLDGNVAPVSYDITVKPDAKAMRFAGGA